jgi:hypothetical protein
MQKIDRTQLVKANVSGGCCKDKGAGPQDNTGGVQAVKH